MSAALFRFSCTLLQTFLSWFMFLIRTMVCSDVPLPVILTPNSKATVSYCQPHQGPAREVFPIKINIPWQTWKMFPQCEFDKLICAACSDAGGSPWLPQYWPLNCSSHHPRPSHSAGITITNTITPIQLVLLFLLLLLPFSWYCYFL